DEFDDRDRGSVGRSDAGLDNPRIAAVAIGITGRKHVEELGELRVVHQPRLGKTAVRKSTALGERDQLLDIGAKLLRLGRPRRDLLMLDERSRHVAEQGCTMTGGALKLTAANTMAHDLSFRSSGVRVR